MTTLSTTTEDLIRQLDIERARADYAWKNTYAIEAAYQDARRRWEKAEMEVERLRKQLGEVP